MQFLDEVVITAQSGKGGDGAVTGRHETGMPHGGPSGGNGGKGGSVVLEAVQDENTLLYYKYHREFKAKPGESGRSKDQYGADADNLVMSVPVGTIVRDKEQGQILHHFTKIGEQRTLLRGGIGGLGNMEFKDAVHQYPQFATLGEPGQKKTVTLELQLFADVALIGTPSVGKSSLINTVSNTKAKVADYPFTTLIPHLGSVQMGDERFNIVDVPGLIAGAAEGKGLGNAFLRHILKTKVLSFIVDMTRYESGLEDIPLLCDELISYVQDKFSQTDYFGDPIHDVKVSIEPDDTGELLYFVINATQNDKPTILMKKVMQFVVNKQDLVNDEEIQKEYVHAMRKVLQAYCKKKCKTKLSDNVLFHCTHVVSAATHYGIDDWIKKLSHYMTLIPSIQLYDKIAISQTEKDIFITDITDTEKDILIEKNYLEPTEAKFINVRYVQDFYVSKMVFTLMRGNDEAEMRFWKTLEQKNIIPQLESAGVRKGDVLKIKSYYEGVEDKYIVF